jgi:hypothetical protein
MRWFTGPTSSTPPRSFQAIRVVAWGAIYLSKRVDKLNELRPKFHCPSCLLPEKDLARGCPRCELTEAVDAIRERMIERAARLWGKPGGPWPFPDWPLERVQTVYHYVAGLLAESEDKISGDWFEDVAALARVILDERQHEKELNQPVPQN